MICTYQYENGGLTSIKKTNVDNQGAEVKVILGSWLDIYETTMSAQIKHAHNPSVRKNAEGFVHFVKISAARVAAMHVEYALQLGLGYCGTPQVGVRDSAREIAEDAGKLLVGELSGLAASSVITYVSGGSGIGVAGSVGAYAGIIAGDLYEDSALESLVGDLGVGVYDRVMVIQRVSDVVNNPEKLPTREIYSIAVGDNLKRYRQICRLFEGDQIFPTADRRGTFFDVRRISNQIVMRQYNVQGLQISTRSIPNFSYDISDIKGVYTYSDKSAAIFYKVFSIGVPSAKLVPTKEGLAIARIDSQGSLTRAKLMVTSSVMPQVGGASLNFGSIGNGAFCYFLSAKDERGRSLGNNYISQGFDPVTLSLFGEITSRDQGDARNPHCSSCGPNPGDVYTCRGGGGSILTATLGDGSIVTVQHLGGGRRLIKIKTPIYESRSPELRNPLILPGPSTNPFFTPIQGPINLPSTGRGGLVSLPSEASHTVKVTENPNSVNVIAGFNSDDKLDVSDFPMIGSPADLQSQIVPVSPHQYSPQDFLDGKVPTSFLYGNGGSRRRSIDTSLNSSVYSMLRLPNNQTVIFSDQSFFNLTQLIKSYIFFNSTTTAVTSLSPSTQVVSHFPSIAMTTTTPKNNDGTNFPHSNGENKSSNLPVIIGSVVGGIALLSLAILSLCRARRSNRVALAPVPTVLALNTIASSVSPKEINDGMFGKPVMSEDAINDAGWHCDFNRDRSLECQDSLHTAKRIVTRLSTTPWGELEGDIYDNCSVNQVDNLKVTHCMGEQTEYIEYTQAALPDRALPLLGYAVLNGLAMMIIPEAVGDALYLSGSCSKQQANYIKNIVSTVLMLATCSWISLVLAKATTLGLESLGCSPETASLLGNTVGFFGSLGNNFSPTTLAVTLAHYAGGRAGLWAEKSVVNYCSTVEREKTYQASVS